MHPRVSRAIFLFGALAIIGCVYYAPRKGKCTCAVYETILPASEGWLSNRVTTNRPTQADLYKLIYNQTYSEATDIFINFQNLLNAKAGITFVSNLPVSIHEAFDAIIIPRLKNNFPDENGKWFFAEIGSFVGSSAIAQAKKLDSLGFPDVPILCIDSWTGDVILLEPRFDEFAQLDAPNIPRPQYYSQFMMNVQSAILNKEISPTHIVPLNLPSISGVRWMATAGISPHYIYLDSAHNAAETLLELHFSWMVLRPGGIMMGDDYGSYMPSVVDDVDIFARDKGLVVGTFGRNQWYLAKPM